MSFKLRSKVPELIFKVPLTNASLLQINVPPLIVKTPDRLIVNVLIVKVALLKIGVFPPDASAGIIMSSFEFGKLAGFQLVAKFQSDGISYPGFSSCIEFVWMGK